LDYGVYTHARKRLTTVSMPAKAAMTAQRGGMVSRSPLGTAAEKVLMRKKKSAPA
jgi:hypothetical protein